MTDIYGRAKRVIAYLGSDVEAGKLFHPFNMIEDPLEHKPRKPKPSLPANFPIKVVFPDNLYLTLRFMAHQLFHFEELGPSMDLLLKARDSIVLSKWFKRMWLFKKLCLLEREIHCPLERRFSYSF